MKVRLDTITASSQQVRTTLNGDEMLALMQSIKEQGLLQAVKLRPAGEEYTIVFGHRRVEAHRRLGLTEIEAVVEDIDDSTTMIQALIENLQREDLGPLDKARGFKALKDATGSTQAELGKMVGMGSHAVSALLALLREPEEIQQMLEPIRTNVPSNKRSVLDTGSTIKTDIEPQSSAKISAKHVQLVRQSGLEEAARIEILKTAAKEGLTAEQAALEAAVLMSSTTREKREKDAAWEEKYEKMYGTKEEQKAREALRVKLDLKQSEQEWWNFHAGRGAKNLVRRIKTERKGWENAWLIVERGAIGIEHMPYIEKRLRGYIAQLTSFADELKTRREKEIGHD